jgi:hypothetical protein
MARMGHDSERAAIIYQHEARGADLVITTAIDAHIMTGQAGASNGPLMARDGQNGENITERDTEHGR